MILIHFKNVPSARVCNVPDWYARLPAVPRVGDTIHYQNGKWDDWKVTGVHWSIPEKVNLSSAHYVPIQGSETPEVEGPIVFVKGI